MKGREAKWCNPKLSMGNGLKCSEITPKNYISQRQMWENLKNLNHQQVLIHINRVFPNWYGERLFVGYTTSLLSPSIRLLLITSYVSSEIQTRWNYTSLSCHMKFDITGCHLCTCWYIRQLISQQFTMVKKAVAPGRCVNQPPRHWAKALHYRIS